MIIWIYIVDVVINVKCERTSDSSIKYILITHLHRSRKHANFIFEAQTGNN